MERIDEQVHSKFKVFSGKLAADQSLGPVSADVEAWVRSAKVAPKSIGIEYIEAAGQFVLSIGYRDDEPGYEVKLSTVGLGRVESLEPAGLARIEQAMAAASSKLKNVICHELYVTDKKDLLMVVMTHVAA